MHHHIGTQVVAVLVLHVFLHLVLATFTQAAVLQNRGQQLLAPVALHLTVADQRLGQTLGLGSQPQRAVEHRLHLCLECSRIAVVALPALLEGILHLSKFLSQWRQQGIHLPRIALFKGSLTFFQQFLRGILHLVAECRHLLLLQLLQRPQLCLIAFLHLLFLLTMTLFRALHCLRLFGLRAFQQVTSLGFRLVQTLGRLVLLVSQNTGRNLFQLRQSLSQ